VRGVPGKFLGENFAGGVGGDEGVDARAGAGIAVIREVAEEDMKPSGVFSTVALGKRADRRKRRATGVSRAASRAMEDSGL